MQTEPIDLIDETGVSEDEKIPTAGEVLLQERQRLGLNEKEVADQLHITMHYVKALESNSYEKLPGAVFAKGYIKSYALLLGLDAEDLLARYDEFNTRQQAKIEEASRQLRARRKKDRNKPLVIMSLLVFVGGFLGLWLVYSYFGDDAVSEMQTTAESMNSADGIRPALSRQAEQQLIAQPQITLEGDAEESPTPSPQPTRIAPSIVGAAGTVEEQSSLGSTESMPLSALEPADVDIGVPGGEQDPSVASQTPVEGQPTTVSGEPASDSALGADQPRVISIEAIGDDVLRISFTGESWIEVNDSESQQIYRDIREAGDVLEITGSAPFNILLGDAPFARMSLNGDEIDLAEDIRIDNSARLTVGL